MKHRPLGNDGPEVSAIGFGAWPIGGGMGTIDEENAIATVRTAIDAGITLIDTAQAYRTSEHVIGKALKDGYRDRCFLATKVSGRYSREDIEFAIEHSLHELEVDHVDLFQVHSWNSSYPIEETMEAMADVQRKGLTRYIGVSNFNAERMETAMEIAPFQSVQPRYNMIDRGIENEDVGFCREHGIGILAHSPLAKGLITGKYTADHVFPDDDERTMFPRFKGDLFRSYVALAGSLQDLAADKGITLVQMAIAWALRLPEMSSVLVGGKSPEQVEEHVKAASVSFSQDELDRIDIILEDLPEEH